VPAAHKSKSAGHQAARSRDSGAWWPVLLMSRRLESTGALSTLPFVQSAFLGARLDPERARHSASVVFTVTAVDFRQR
jgi:hypothetical protein